MWISGSGGSGIAGKGRSGMDVGSNFDRKGFGLERARLVGFGYIHICMERRIWWVG